MPTNMPANGPENHARAPAPYFNVDSPDFALKQTSISHTCRCGPLTLPFNLIICGEINIVMSVMYLSEGSSNVLSYYVRVMILTHGDTGHSMCFIFLCHERNICPVHCLTCTSPFHWTSAASSVQRPIYVCPLKRSKRSLFHYEYDFKIRFDS